MKNDIDDLLNSVFGSRTLRTGGQAAGRDQPEAARLTPYRAGTARGALSRRLAGRRTPQGGRTSH